MTHWFILHKISRKKKTVVYANVRIYILTFIILCLLVIWCWQKEKINWIAAYMKWIITSFKSSNNPTTHRYESYPFSFELDSQSHIRFIIDFEIESNKIHWNNKSNGATEQRSNGATKQRSNEATETKILIHTQ